MSVAKFPTDRGSRAGHKRRAMPRFPIDRSKFTQFRKSAGYTSDARLWEAVHKFLGLAGEPDRSRLSKILTNREYPRGPKAEEVHAMSRLLKVSEVELMIVLGIIKESDATNSLTISGHIKEGGQIVATTQPSHLMVERQYPKSAYAYGGSLLKIVDDSMGDRYHRNDLVGFGEKTDELARFVGEPVVAHLKNGIEVLRVLHAGGTLGWYALVATVQDKRYPPIITNEIEWIAPIEAIYPALPD